MKKFSSVSDLVRELQPVNPVYCIRPESIKLACNFFVNNFPGKPLYAVKTNPHRGTPFPLSGTMLSLFQCVFSLTEFVFGKENMLNKVVNQRTNKQQR